MKRDQLIGVIGLVLVGLAGPVGFAETGCTESCSAVIAACKRTMCAGLGGRARRQCTDGCRKRSGCPSGVGTVAYVVTQCHVDSAGLLGKQELRIQRGGCAPMTVVPLAYPAPIADPFGFCQLVGRNRVGFGSVVAGVFQRLGVTPDGSGVVFEVTNEFQLIPKAPLTAEQQGFFFVRSDGTGLRWLGPPSRDPTYRIFPSPSGISSNFETYIPFSPSGRIMVYTDEGPGPDGQEMTQVFTLDLATRKRTQVTHLPALPPDLTRRHTDRLAFPDEHTITFSTDAFGPERARYAIRTNGTGLRRLPFPSAPPAFVSGRVAPFFLVTGPTIHTVDLAFRGTVPEPIEFLPDLPITEVFGVDGRELLQLTDFHRGDTASFSSSRTSNQRILLVASTNKLGTNPLENCQLFSIGPLGAGLRQLTQWSEGGEPSKQGCFFGMPPGCAIIPLKQYPKTGRLLLYSNCDPFDFFRTRITGVTGSQVFSIRPDGTGLRQLTHTCGSRPPSPDGVVDVEIPGPVDSSGAVR
jgi:hypothetical protein